MEAADILGTSVHYITKMLKMAREEGPDAVQSMSWGQGRKKKDLQLA